MFSLTQFDIEFRSFREVIVIVSNESEQTAGIVVEVACLTDVGRVRQGNEDSLVVADLTTKKALYESGAWARQTIGGRGLLLAVADGMGGAEAGEIASRMAVEHLASAFVDYKTGATGAEAVRKEIVFAGDLIKQFVNQHPAMRGMGTTLTVAIIFGARAIIGQVGDSRCYLLRNGQLKLLTQDQTLMQTLIDAGVMTEEEADASGRRHVILQAVGTGNKLDPAITEVELAPGDYLLLSSDGLTNMVKLSTLQEIILQSPTLPETCARLVANANENGGEDNITVVIARFNG